ncbi:MAG: 5-amino-6-(D-ribitylamino)uracil--L-tyrosine 4-hydroxyphenyl transferase CofH [Pseudomonadales bacterium]|jgi:FO synthase|nr:5-amino-6-(D-ribitylamino)uracil--L-tyrosine 4-hydroxyphenyl transferase CofH [Pseudomonadales bacterium]MDP7594665.1 5-amino-6-(D-ribitylamino)uracil--L-tyrosine 4-hydroxyphenyl transferase CofH [Pseudomonadales bacterium]HJN49747.1 5-amino-6-(D-ribitylamino)uracil--L-tyrosine 4-hydroxyphenyl transferase CofH [Pseudomonadales bacterium]|tara:strand:+ start:11924 stop:14440 length:2517 start_codon:yes stop_codon:yes gene_type:complete
MQKLEKRSNLESLLANAVDGVQLSGAEIMLLAEQAGYPQLQSAAAAIRDQGHANVISYSRKVFVPLTHLCRDVCHYCTFARVPRKVQAPYLLPEEVLKIATAGAEADCKEILFTLGDKPELRYKSAREGLSALGHQSTISYLGEVAELVHRESGLLPHLNPGLMSADELKDLRKNSVSMGIMLESASTRLMEKGMAHHGSPDKLPARRIETIRLAGEAAIPFTSGILIGIGETRLERIESLLLLRELHAEHGHIQEIIVQNFRAKADTQMENAEEPDLQELLWTIAMARIIFGAHMNVQAPPNLSPGVLQQIVAAGINDWGGVSPVTPDFVNPEAPWPHLQDLADETAAAGKLLIERLAIYPAYAMDTNRWMDDGLSSAVLGKIDGQGFASTELWSAGAVIDPPQRDINLLSGIPMSSTSRHLQSILDRALAAEELSEEDIVSLFRARGSEFAHVCRAADEMRSRVVGDKVTYIVNRNINYTNVCYFRCQFCAFSKGKTSENLRGKPYDLAPEEIMRRTREAWSRGATEVCLQGGIHPDYNGKTYIDICHTIKQVTPDIHIHAFSPLEVWQGAHTLGVELEDFLGQLKQAGLGTLPGTAAEILDDEVRATLCPDKINTSQWFEVMEAAHKVGFNTTATIMYGHIEEYRHLARHLMRLRALQKKTGGFTEFVVLPFIHMEAPIYLKGKARKGPTFRESILMHAIARLVLHPYFRNIQASWTKLGHKGVHACLNAGVNDLGGTLMNESITRAAGASHGEETTPEHMEALIRSAGRTPEQRTTRYQPVSPEQQEKSFGAADLQAPVFNSARKFDRQQKVGNKKLLRPGTAGEDKLSSAYII